MPFVKGHVPVQAKKDAFTRAKRRGILKEIIEADGYSGLAQLQRTLMSRYGLHATLVTLSRDLANVNLDLKGVDASGASIDSVVLDRFDEVYRKLVGILDDSGNGVSDRVNAGKAAAGILSQRFDVSVRMREFGKCRVGASSAGAYDESGKGLPSGLPMFSDSVVEVGGSSSCSDELGGSGVPVVVSGHHINSEDVVVVDGEKGREGIVQEDGKTEDSG